MLLPFIVGKYWYILIRNCRIETKSVLKYVVNVLYGPDAFSTAGFDLSGYHDVFEATVEEIIVSHVILPQ